MLIEFMYEAGDALRYGHDGFPFSGLRSERQVTLLDFGIGA